jgi:hypothetical protein
MPHLRQPPPTTTRIATHTGNSPTPIPEHRGTVTTPTPGELRGIPIQARGVGGAIAGSRPGDEPR